MSSQKLIYKICSRSEWESALAQGEYPGAPIDVQDGFIHFSSSHQVKETASKHFAGLRDLVLVAFATEQFGDDLRWEVSRGGDLFPHLYGRLLTNTACEIFDLPLDDDGQHIFPPHIEQADRPHLDD